MEAARKLAALAAAACLGAFGATPSEITVRLALDHDVYVDGERMRAVIDVANASGDVIDCRTNSSPDRLIVDLYRASDRYQYEKVSDVPFTAGFILLSGEGQKLETFLADHFPFNQATRYYARAVLVHAGTRYESSLSSLNVVTGMRCGNALQMFKSNDGLRRVFELVHWNRDGMEHLFLKARDEGDSVRTWATTDLGPVLRVTRPKLSVMPTGEVVVLHRMTQDTFIRSEFWSLPDAFEFNVHDKMLDPDMAGAMRVKELYQDAGGVEPVKKAWWKFW